MGLKDVKMFPLLQARRVGTPLDQVCLVFFCERRVFNSPNSRDACIFLRSVSELDAQKKDIDTTSRQDSTQRSTVLARVIRRRRRTEELRTPWGWTVPDGREQHLHNIDHVWLYGPRTGG